MGLDFQLHRASVDVAKGFRQFEKAGHELSKDNVDSGLRHLQKGLGCFSHARDHLASAEGDAYNKAGKEISAGSTELQKSIDAWSAGNADSAKSHYDNAIAKYDQALDLIG